MVLESKYERQQRLKRQRYSGILGFVLACTDSDNWRDFMGKQAVSY